MKMLRYDKLTEEKIEKFLKKIFEIQTVNENDVLYRKTVTKIKFNQGYGLGHTPLDTRTPPSGYKHTP